MDQSDDRRTVVQGAALRLLAPREHSRFELERKLADRDHPVDLIALVLDDLAAAGLQSDERFAETYVRSALGRGQGPLKIRAGLRQRGVDDALASSHLGLADDEWQDLAAEVVRKRFGQAPPADRAEWARQARFLAGRGFTSAVAVRVLGDLGAV